MSSTVNHPQEEQMAVQMSVSDEVSVSAWALSSMLIAHILEHEHDLDGFHVLERQAASPWLPQALACIAAYLVTELAEERNKSAADADKITPVEQLRQAVSQIMHIQDSHSPR